MRRSRGSRRRGLRLGGELVGGSGEAHPKVLFGVEGIVREGAEDAVLDRLEQRLSVQPYPFRTAAELLVHRESTGLSVAEVMLANEFVVRDNASVRAGLTHFWEVMETCEDWALTRTRLLPGRPNVPRRVPIGIGCSASAIRIVTRCSGRSG